MTSEDKFDRYREDRVFEMALVHATILVVPILVVIIESLDGGSATAVARDLWAHFVLNHAVSVALFITG